MEIRQGYNENAPLVEGGILVNDPKLVLIIYRRTFIRALAHHAMRETELLYFASLIVCLSGVATKAGEINDMRLPVDG